MSFEARYSGECTECGEAIRPGDMILSNYRDGYLHQECNLRPRTQQARPVCQICFQMKSLSGNCACDE